MAKLYIFSGLPGVGKSTISQGLSKVLNCAYVRIDTIEQSLRKLCSLVVYDEGYHLAHLLAADNLNQGISVVADSCNPITLTRVEWEKVSIDAMAQFVNIEIICSDSAEHRNRVENRISTIDGLILPTWNEVKNREYHEWSKDRVIIDTAGKEPEQCIVELVDNLGAANGGA